MLVIKSKGVFVVKNIFRNILLIGAIQFSGQVLAQNVSYEAFRLADIFVQSNWQAIDQSMPAISAMLEKQMTANGSSDDLPKLYAVKFRAALSRDNIAKVVAQLLTQKLTTQEITEVSAFMQTNAGKKYLGISSEFSKNTQLIVPIFQQACRDADLEVSAADKRGLRLFCNQF